MALTQKEKRVLWIAGGSLAAISMFAFLFRPKPQKQLKVNYGIKVDPLCNQFEVTSEAAVREAIRSEIRMLSATSAVDPFEVARNYLAKAAPNCTTYPENTRNPGEAALFIMTFNTVIDLMLGESLLSNTQVETFKQMARAWGESQGISPDSF